MSEENKHEAIRLQGTAWHNKKSELTNLFYSKNVNGHIKGFYKDSSGVRYTHWLNDEELVELFSGVITDKNNFEDNEVSFNYLRERNRLLEEIINRLYNKKEMNQEMLLIVDYISKKYNVKEN